MYLLTFVPTYKQRITVVAYLPSDVTRPHTVSLYLSLSETPRVTQYQFKTTLKYKNVNYDVQLCYLIATAPDAPSENVKW